MQIKNKVILMLRGSSKELKERLAGVLGVSLAQIYRYINTNDDNLTKAAALNVIRQELNLKDEEILESDPVMTMQK